MGRGGSNQLAQAGFASALGAGRGQRSPELEARRRPRPTEPEPGVILWRRGGSEDGEIHRDDGPALVITGLGGYRIGLYWFGAPCTAWFQNGKLHRRDGPAFMRRLSAEDKADGLGLLKDQTVWALNGIPMSEEKWRARLANEIGV